MSKTESIDNGRNDDGQLSGEEKRLIESRVADYERDPQSAIPWEEFEARMRERLEQ